MIYGYARVSTQDQNLDLQLDALGKAGAETIFSEKVSGTKTDRPELTELLSTVGEGDKVIIWKLDRLGRSTRHLIEVAEDLKDRGVELVSIKDNIDTSTAAGKLFFNMMAALAEFERDMLSERTIAGQKAAVDRGAVVGRPVGLSDQLKAVASQAVKIYKRRDMSATEACGLLGISRASYYKILRYRGALETA